MAKVIQELHQTRQALLEREADLAAGVPVAARRDEEAQVEKARRVEEQRDRRVAKQVARWTSELSLSSYQAEEMSSLLRARDEGAVNLKTSVASGEIQREEAGESWRQIESDYNDSLSFLLSPTQLETYQASSRGKD